MSVCHAIRRGGDATLLGQGFADSGCTSGHANTEVLQIFMKDRIVWPNDRSNAKPKTESKI